MLLSLTQLGPQWSGPRLRFRDPSRVGLGYPELVGWSDFYAGSACDVRVARATDGEREGWLVWGGTLGVRAIPEGWDVDEAVAQGVVEEAPLLWVDDVGVFPSEVAQVVAGSWITDTGVQPGVARPYDAGRR
jgi:hypothetical protein